MLKAVAAIGMIVLICAAHFSNQPESSPAISPVPHAIARAKRPVVEAVHETVEPRAGLNQYRNSNIIEEAYRSSNRWLYQHPVRDPATGKTIWVPPGTARFLGPINTAMLSIGFNANGVGGREDDDSLYRNFYATLQPILDDPVKCDALWRALHP